MIAIAIAQISIAFCNLIFNPLFLITLVESESVIDLNPLFEFSRTYCVGICTFLVPANIVATLTTLAFIALKRPSQQKLVSATLAISFALVMCFHVATWFMVGVVRSETFILLALGLICLCANIVGLLYPGFVQQIYHFIASKITKKNLFKPQN